MLFLQKTNDMKHQVGKTTGRAAHGRSKGRTKKGQAPIIFTSLQLTPFDGTQPSGLAGLGSIQRGF